MSAQLQPLISAYAQHKNIQLAPNWWDSCPAELDITEFGAVHTLCSAKRWSPIPLRTRPRAHEFPLLLFHPKLGWGLALQWTNLSTIHVWTPEGRFELPYESGLTLTHIDFSQPKSLRHGDGAIDAFRDAILRRKPILFYTGIATAIINIIALGASIYSMQVYDRVMPRGSFSTLIVLTVGMLFALLMDFLIRTTRAKMADKEAASIEGEVSEFFYRRMQAVRLDARPRSIGTMAAQLRGTEHLRSLLSSASLFVMVDLPFSILFLAVVAAIGGVVVLVPLIAFVAATTVAVVMVRLIQKETAASQVSSNRKNGLLVEALDGAETIKATQGGWEMLASWNKLVDEVHASDLKVKQWSAISSASFSFIQQLAYVGVVCGGAYLVSNGTMTMGGVIACSILSGRISGPLVSSLPNLIVQWSYAKSALSSLDAILALPSDQPIDYKPVRLRGASGQLRLQNVRFEYNGARNGLRVSSLNIGAGEKIGIVGPVGSGKSTLLKVIAGLYAPTEGYVLLDNLDVRQIAEEDLRRELAYLPQDYRLMTGTLRSNLTMGLGHVDDNRLTAVARCMGLDDLIRKHPQGFDLPIAEGGSGLSGGQRALVGLTRLLLGEPKVMLLDEPTASLDQDAEARVLETIVGSAGTRCGVILVTHKASLLRHVQRLIVVANGSIVADGPRDEVLNKINSAKRPRPPAAPAELKIIQ